MERGAQQIEYEVGHELWKVGRWESLQAEFPTLTEALAPAFHLALEPDKRAWMIVRRLYGIQPVLPPLDSDPNEFRARTRDELASELGITQAQLRAELDAMRGAVKAIKLEPAPDAPEEQACGSSGDWFEQKDESQARLRFNAEEALDKHGFAATLFDVAGRDQAENRRERAWFAERVSKWEKMLENPMTYALARQLLMNELHLRRVESELCRLSPSTKEYTQLTRIKTETETVYQKQLVELDTIAPWMGAVGNKLGFAGVLADLVRGYQQFYATGSHALFDGIFQATEVRCELRRSKQMPEPRYRAGLVTYLNEAKANLWNAQWKPAFTAQQLRAMDRAFRATLSTAMDEQGAQLPDLESDGPDGEYNEQE